MSELRRSDDLEANQGTDSASTHLTVADVYREMRAGQVFYTEARGFTARVNAYECPCGRDTLRSASDATVSNNLDNLRTCS